MFDSLKRRVDNIIFTIGDTYNIDVKYDRGTSRTDSKSKVYITNPEAIKSAGLSNEDAEIITLYGAAHEGSHIKETNPDAIEKFFLERIKEGYDKERLFSLFNIAEDVRVDYAIIKQRPGFADMRECGAKAMTKLIKASGNEEKDFLAAVCARTYGIDLSKKYKVDKAKVQEMVKDIMKVTDMDTTDEALELAQEVYDKYFGKPEHKMPGSSGRHEENEQQDSEQDKEQDKEIEQEDSKSKGNGSVDSESTDKEDEKDFENDKDDDFENDKDEENDDEACIDKTVIEDMIDKLMGGNPIIDMADEEQKKKMRDKQERIDKKKEHEKMSDEKYEESWGEHIKLKWGNSFLSKEELLQIEREECTDKHAGAKIHWTDCTTGKMLGMFSKAKKVNEEMYKALVNMYKGQEKELIRTIEEELRAAKDPDACPSESGLVVAKKAWRADKLHDSKIFVNSEYDEIGEYVVDILLDASGSQSIRSSQVAIAAKITADALCEVGIPVRVSGFTNETDFTILMRYRDYDDAKYENENIFKFKGLLDNRDGLAIKVVARDLYKRKEPNKILIVLSDGLPEDTVYMGRRIKEKGGVTSYRGSIAVNDTAHQIREVRRKGVAVLGIFINISTTALEQEKLMFGNDFAYIRNMKDFAKTVGRYLKIQIKNAGLGG